MPSRTRRQANIPKVFKINNYFSCSKWGVKEWALALTERFKAREMWRWDCREGNNATEDTIKNIRRIATNMLTKPLASDLNSSSFKMHTAPIRDQTPCDYFDALFVMHDPKYAEWINIAYASTMPEDESSKLSTREQSFYSLPAWEMHAECSGSDFPATHETLFIAVDMGTTNELLVKEFLSWLRRTRKATKLVRIPMQYSKKTLENWHMEHLLPYLDLSFWAMTHGVEFKEEDIAKALFPKDNNSDVVERIKRTISINAKKIISEEVVTAINRQLRASKDLIG
jgi:hypothetical protein